MAAQAEIVKARLSPDANRSARAAMAADAGPLAAAVEVVVMAHDAVHRAVPVVREGQHQRLAAAQEWLTQSQRRAPAQQCSQRDE